MTAILALRHAPTAWNTAGLIQGRTDIPLDAAGRAHCADLIIPPRWTEAKCLSSPLARAMETARLLALDAEPEPRLIEMHWGAWEGQSLGSLRQTLGATMADNESRGLDFRPPGGESPREVQARLRPLLTRQTNPTILVTHKGVLRALYALATGWTMHVKPKQKMLDDHAHAFDTSPDGAIVLTQLNIPLRRT